MSRSYLLILGERDAIAWVLRTQRMAFPATPRAEVAALAAGDRLFLYATRGAWRNPTRDRGRIIGRATVKSSVRMLEQPIEIAGRTFVSGCDLSIDKVVPYPGGVQLQPFVERLAAFPKPHAWSIYLRRALLALPPADAKLLEEALLPLLVPRQQALPSYPSMTAAVEA